MTAIIKWWDESQMVEVKKLFAPNLNDNEFQTFVWIWKATGLNPFLREIWAVKYGTQSANIFIWRDWYRKSAQANKEYDYHSVDAVYENDKFEVKNWEVEHIYNFTNRWKLVWAYCIVKRKSSTKAMFTFVELAEYNTNQSVWKTKPATMIKKVAEAQWLRGTFQELFAWTYDESEDWNVPKEDKKEEVKNEISVEEQEKNYNEFEEKMMCVKNEDDLKKVFLEFNKKRKEKPNLMNKEQIDELIKLKDEIKTRLQRPNIQEEDIQDWEIETTEVES